MTPEQTQNMSDHDLLITMHEQIKNIRIDIKELKDGTSERLSKLEEDHVSSEVVNDHEARLREIEKFKENWTGRNAVLAVIFMFVIGLLGNFITKFL